MYEEFFSGTSLIRSFGRTRKRWENENVKINLKKIIKLYLKFIQLRIACSIINGDDPSDFVTTQTFNNVFS
jgi:hypothetical protein